MSYRFIRFGLTALAVLTLLTPAFAQKKPRKAPGAADSQWEVRKAPVLTSFTPTQGAPGSAVTLKGQHFDTTMKVRFNGRDLKIVKIGKTELTVKISRDAVTDRFVLVKPGFSDQSAEGLFSVVRAPKISDFNPPRGDVGITVTIHGLHFLPKDQPLLGNIPMPVTRARPKTLQAKVPTGAPSGRISIRRNGRVVATSKRTFTVSLPPPLITSFSPLRGSPGTVVKINGTNFDTRDKVSLAGKPLKIRKRSASSLEVLIGRNQSGTFAIRGSGGRSASSTGTFYVVRPPTVKDFQPKFGPPATRIRVFGQHFLAGDAVTIGDRALTVRTTNPTLIVAEVPAGVTSGRVAVRRGTKSVYARGRFDVQYPPSVTAVTPAGGPPGITVKIDGTSFSKGASVLLAGRRLEITKKKLPTTLWVKLPKEARSGQLVVVTSAGSAQSKRPFQVVQYAQLSSFYPPKCSYGATLRLQGANFHKGIRVFVGKVELAVTRIAPTQVWAKVPQNAKTDRVTIETWGKRFSSKAKLQVVAPAPLLAFTVAPEAARRGAEVTLTLTPAANDVSVYFDGRPLPMRVLGNGKRIVVTVPSDAKTGYFEVEYKGQRYRSPKKFRVR